MGRHRPFAHLHTHSSHSLRDSIATVEGLVAAAVADAQPALAVTDHGNLGGIWKLVAEADRAGLKAIPGAELYLAFGSRLERVAGVGVGDGDSSGDDPGGSGPQAARGAKLRAYQHLTVLATDPAGWRNLMAVSAAAHEPEAFWHKPRVDMDLLASHSEGLVVLSGCLGGPVAGPLAAGDRDAAAANLASLVEAFGAANVYVEVMDHDIPAETRIVGDLVGLAGRFGLGVVATNDAHHVAAGDADAHDAWLCMGSDATVSTPGRWQFSGSGYHLRTAAEMRVIFDDQPGTEGACDATLEIASRVAGRVIAPPGRYLPRFGPLPDGVSADQHLMRLVSAGAKRIYGDPLPAAAKQRLRTEYDVIVGQGFSDYFLIVADMVDWARSQGIRVGFARGSAGGSAVSYCLGITRIDPIANGLLFERFLDPTRAGMPDIDTDFETRGRDRVIAYLTERWGADRVARIGTTGYIRSRSALKSAARVLGQASLGDNLSTKVTLGAGGQPLPISELVDPSNEAAAPFRSALAKAGAQGAEIVGLARAWEGVASNVGIHACGVLVSQAPLTDLVPVRRDHAAKDPWPGLISEWDGWDCDALGALKLDALSIRNLDMLADAAAAVNERWPEVGFDPDEASMDAAADPRAAAAWRLIGEGRTAGCFQLETGGMQQLCRDVAPSNLGELADVIALYRPGPLAQSMHTLYADRKAGRGSKDFYDVYTDDPAEAAILAEVLGETRGCVIYQESMMALGRVVAGFDPATTSRLRKAISKKRPAEMKILETMFLDGAVSDRAMDGTSKLAFARHSAERVWAAIVAAGAYAFVKAHSYGYAALAYATAYAKANWPAIYGAAMLASTDDDDRRLAMIRSLRAEGVEVVGPELNVSALHATAGDDGVVRLGLAEIKGIGEAAAEVIAERDANGPFTSLADLVGRRRVAPDGSEPGEKDSYVVGFGVAERLIEAGAADAFGARLGMIQVLRALRVAPDMEIPASEWGVVERAARERGALGVGASASPLRSLASQLSSWRPPGGAGPKPVSLTKVDRDGGRYATIAVVSRAKVETKGRRRMYVTLEGSGADIEGVIWTEALGRLEAEGRAPRLGQVIGVTATLRSRQITVEVPSDDPEDPEPTFEVRLRRELTIHDVWEGPLDDPGVADGLAEMAIPGRPPGSAEESVAP